MAWLRLDDGFAQHPKVVALTPKDRWTWLEVLCYCARYRTAGELPASVAQVVRGASPSFIERCQGLGLLDPSESADGWSVHDWAIYNGGTVAERVGYYLERYPGASANEVHRAIGGKRELVLAEVARVSEITGSTAGTREPANPVPESVPGNPQSGTQSGSLSRARAYPSPEVPREEPQAEDRLLSAERSETTANGLPVEKERLTIELLAAIGNAADEGTPQVVRRYAAQLPEGSLAKVLQSVREKRVDNKARYVVGSLKKEVEERHADELGSKVKDLRRDPEAWVRELGWKMPTDVFEEALGELLPDEENEDERIRLADLAADLRAETAA